MGSVLKNCSEKLLHQKMSLAVVLVIQVYLHPSPFIFISHRSSCLQLSPPGQATPLCGSLVHSSVDQGKAFNCLPGHWVTVPQPLSICGAHLGHLGQLGFSLGLSAASSGPSGRCGSLTRDQVTSCQALWLQWHQTTQRDFQIIKKNRRKVSRSEFQDEGFKMYPLQWFLQEETF